ncbi:MAG TPA: hypothetical protein VK761_01665 [Solirubrobacteraceae bacterium]|nr:hypothetical protein [Solirubrobacteraceae bacterium]
MPATSVAAVLHFGSPLRVHASLSTNDLAYKGINTQVGNSVVHTSHFGADTALWNAGDRAPAAGDVAKVSLEGCAAAAKGGPPPLTQIHFQTLAPQGGGAVKVMLTSAAFKIPVCRRHGASSATVTTYEPYGLCIDKGDFVAFNDEGGFVEGAYRAGVPYKVIARAHATLDSFIGPGATGNGAVLSPSILAPAAGFATSHRQELTLRATLTTGGDSIPGCRHGIPR